MATVDGITVAEARRIEGKTVVSATINGNGDLMLTFENGATLNAGSVSGPLTAHAALAAAHGATGAVVGTTNAQSLSGKTLITPIIASFVNAQHSHANAAGGGKVFPFSGVRGERTATQNVPDTTNRLVDFSAASVYDTDAYKTSGTVFTIPATGFYDIQVIIPWEGNGTGRRSVDIKLNDASTDSSQGISLNKKVELPGFGFPFQQNVSVLAEPLTQGDYIKVIAYQASGIALNLLGSAGGRTLITIRRVG